MSLDTKSTRREALRRMLFIAGGASVAILGASGLVIFLSRSPDTQQAPKATAAVQAVDETSPLSIKVFYAGMANTIGVSEETLQVAPSTTLSDLVSDVCEEHPLLQAMPSMQVLLNGAAPGGDPVLSSGDEVVILATMVGG